MTEYQAIQRILGSAEETEKYRVWMNANAISYLDKVSKEIKDRHKEATRLAAKAYIENIR